MLWVWRKEEKEFEGKEIGSWNSCLIVSQFFDVQGKAGGWRKVCFVCWCVCGGVWNWWYGKCSS